MTKSEVINELASALAKAQSEMGGAHKDSTNPYFNSSYANLAAVWDACRGPLTKNGLSVVQTTVPVTEGVCLETVLLHTSGQWISSQLIMKPVKNDPQGVGSTLSYARRYALAAMVGVYQIDDDGERGSRVREDNYDQRQKVVTRGDGESRSSASLDLFHSQSGETIHNNGTSSTAGSSRPVHLTIDPSIAKLAGLKASSGTYTGKTIGQIYEEDKKSGFKWTRARLDQLNSKTKLPEWTIKYLTYAENMGLDVQ